MYRVQYHESEQTPLIDAYALPTLPTTATTREEVEDNCELYQCEATITEEPMIATCDVCNVPATTEDALSPWHGCVLCLACLAAAEANTEACTCLDCLRHRAQR